MPEGIPDAGDQDRYPRILDAGDIADNPETPQTHELDEYPFLSEEIRTELRKLADSGMTSEKAFDLISGLNDRYGVQETPEGRYNVLHFSDFLHTADGVILDVRVNVYEDMGDAISFSINTVG
jgi:hypothetical protein